MLSKTVEQNLFPPFFIVLCPGSKGLPHSTQHSPLQTGSAATGNEFWLPVGCQFQGGQYQPV
jgi:hypothetical protein